MLPVTVFSISGSLSRFMLCKHVDTLNLWITYIHCVKYTTFSSHWRHVHFSKRWWLWNQPVVAWHWWLWKEPVVKCGKWNVRQATLQQMFKVTIFCTNTCFQSFSSLINCIVYHALLKCSPCRNKMLPQLIRIANWYSIHVKNNEKDEIFVQFLQGSEATFSNVVGKEVTVCFLLR